MGERLIDSMTQKHYSDKRIELPITNAQYIRCVEVLYASQVRLLSLASTIAQFADLHKLKALHQTLATNATSLGETILMSQKENRYIWSIAIQLRKILRYDFFSPALTQNSTFHVGASTDFSLSKKKPLLVCRH